MACPCLTHSKEQIPKVLVFFSGHTLILATRLFCSPLVPLQGLLCVVSVLTATGKPSASRLITGLRNSVNTWVQYSTWNVKEVCTNQLDYYFLQLAEMFGIINKPLW